MNEREKGFLLLTGHFGDQDRRSLTIPQLRDLAKAVRFLENPDTNQELNEKHLCKLGIKPEMSRRIVQLLSDEEQLNAYLVRGKKHGCCPLSRVNSMYPLRLRKKLGLESPGCLWLKGNAAILSKPAVALVGSRDLQPENRMFAEEVGRQAARQGFVLVSGNARGADQTAQNACLREGGEVISILADSLFDKPERERVLYISEEDYDMPFTAQRALHRNHIIHSLGLLTFVAQCSWRKGGTWDGTVQNLIHARSSVLCFNDGSRAVREFEQMGAELIGIDQLSDFSQLLFEERNLLDDR